MVMFPKPKRFESENYLDFIRSLPCAVHGDKCRKYTKGRCDPHHLRTVKAGGDDTDAIPLCRLLHTEVHWSREKFEEKYHINIQGV